MKIQFVDLHANYLSCREEIDEAIAKVIEKTAFISGEFLEKFEEEFANKIGAKYCIGVSSGTSALQISFLAHKKYSVATQANTFIATAESVESAIEGSVEHFIDVDENGLMELESLEKKVWPGCNLCIIPVHLYGQTSDVDSIKQKFDNDVCIIEDCAQAHFARYNDGTYVGSKNTSAFSFFPSKRMGCFGDGGAITTNDEAVYRFAKAYRDHGRTSKYHSDFVGNNMRLDGIQAAILSVKLKHVLDWNDKCRAVARKYNELLKNIEFIKTPEYNERHIYHLYVIRELSSRRDELKKHLESNGISCGIHYPVPIHLQMAFSWANEQELPMTEKLCKEILSLSMYPELSDEQIEYVCDKIEEFYR